MGWIHKHHLIPLIPAPHQPRVQRLALSDRGFFPSISMCPNTRHTAPSAAPSAESSKLLLPPPANTGRGSGRERGAAAVLIEQ